MSDGYLTAPQPVPRLASEIHLWKLVVKDMESRDEFGKKKYGTALHPFNGRDALIDAYQEALDLCVYLRQAIYERDKS
jgi:hypothetical protein